MAIAKILKMTTLSCLMLLSFGTFANAETFINGIDANYPPFGYVDETGKPSGFDVDSMNWIADKMGFEIKHQPMDWDGIIPALQNGKIDMVASGMSITPAREAQVNFSNPYFTLEKVIVVKSNSDLTIEEVFADETRLGVQRGTSEHDFLENKKVNEKLDYELRMYDSGPLAVEDLLNGRVQAVALDIFPANDAISKQKDIKIIGAFIKDDSFGVAVRKTDTELLNTINEGYKLLMADPYWDELKAKYLK